jgi:hypothetical protein
MTWRLNTIAAFMAVVLPLTGCLPRQLVVREMAGLITAGLPALEADDDLATVETALPSQIALVQGLLASAPEDQTLLVLLARLHASYAFAFLDSRLDDGTPVQSDSPSRDELTRQADRHTLKGAAAAWRALTLRRPQLAGLSEVNATGHLGELDRSDVPSLFWWGFNCALSGLRHSDSARGLMLADAGQHAMARIVALEPEYCHGVAHLVLMVASASRPAVLGGVPAQAEAHYRQLKSLAGSDFLLADLLYARHVLAARQQRLEFKTLLEHVVAQSAQPSRHGLLNAIAGQRAGRCLANIDQWFE